MQINLSKSFIYICLTFIIQSCSSAYVPNAVNTPLFGKKGETKVAIHAGTSGIDPQVSYAITNHIGIQMNGSFFNKASQVTGKLYDHQYAELAPGYYTKISEIFRFETYAGFGLGKLQPERENELWDINSNINMSRVFIQPSVGLTNNIVDASFTTRFAAVTLDQDDINRTGMFIEPVITGKVGYKYVKAIFQLGLSINLNNDDIYFMNGQPLLLSVGLQINVHKLFNL
ncbi:hypothetical protein [Aquimarina litoralis]|uniref:hypothetical protein n=1 Tax=Aquimarina litoralis TaxID=584605 RepID=UPI001C57462D|nr:hypothetical protein [Aquimarina litoralis]MBW1294017.1 hypothetical protein [Aquimarina litoralis]